LPIYAKLLPGLAIYNATTFPPEMTGLSISGTCAEKDDRTDQHQHLHHGLPPYISDASAHPSNGADLPESASSFHHKQFSLPLTAQPSACCLLESNGRLARLVSMARPLPAKIMATTSEGAITITPAWLEGQELVSALTWKPC
jgi:hypothetical protein